mmetsp:Transcript_24402/g.46314  ORF Transcript_24402/g.46314 Transcript_24402/m.46314 type:complete len:95 (+) Transcript_24402:478-762(+)
MGSWRTTGSGPNTSSILRSEDGKEEETLTDSPDSIDTCDSAQDQPCKLGGAEPALHSSNPGGSSHTCEISKKLRRRLRYTQEEVLTSTDSTAMV